MYTFLMEMEKVTFPEAVRMLAKRAGITLIEPEKSPGPKEALYGANEFAAKLYHETLMQKESGKAGREYAKKRGFSKELIEKFEIGYAPSSWDALKKAASSFSEDVLIRAGLLVKSEGNKVYDRFRDRLMFPIRNLSGRVVGLGGRSVGDSTPKYMNSPDTEIYKKGNILYGLWVAKQEIRKSDRAIIVEGYTDLLSLRSMGIEGVVASLGTAMTEEQAKLLSRYATNVIILYDADSAGDDAAVRSLDMFLEQGLDVSVVSLPSGHDPDTFAREKGAKAVANLLDSPLSFFAFKFEYLKKRYDMSKIGEKTSAIREIASSVSRIPDPIKKQLWVRELSQEFSIPETVLLRAIPKSRMEESAREASILPDTPEQLEFRLLGFMLADDEAFKIAREALTLDDFAGTASRDLANKVFGFKDDGKEMRAADVLSGITDKESMKVVSESMILAGSDFDFVNECRGLVSKIRRHRIERMMEMKLRDIKRGESKGESVAGLQKEYQKLVELRRRES